MANLQPIPKVTNGKRLLQLVALFFILIVLPLGTVFYTSGGNDSFKEMISELHPYGEIPDFQFSAHNGQILKKEKLADKLVVNAFFSLDDKDADLLGAQIKKLHSVFNDKDEVLFLLYSLSPETDTKERLQAFAEKTGLTDEEQCFLLTGSQQDVHDFLSNGFKWPGNFETRDKTTPLQFGEMPTDIKSYPYIVVADKKSMIRNYYDFKDNKAMGRLVEHLALLLPSRTDDDPEMIRETEK